MLKHVARRRETRERGRFEEEARQRGMKLPSGEMRERARDSGSQGWMTEI